MKGIKLIPMLLVITVLCVIIPNHVTDCYKTEVAITPSPVEEPTTKKSGFFGGIKKLFRGSETTTTATTTTTTVAPIHGVGKLPKLNIPQAPLMPLGPRPDTPPTSPIVGSSQQPPQWPQRQQDDGKTPTTQSAQVASFDHNLPLNPQSTIFGPYRPPKTQPSGIDLSYGGGNVRPNRPPIQRANVGANEVQQESTTAPSTITTTTTVKPKSPALDVDLRMGGATTTKQPFNILNRRPSVKEDFPTLPTPKGATSTANTNKLPETPTAWNQPLPKPSQTLTTNGKTIQAINPNDNNNNRIAFIPHHDTTTTTIGPGVPATATSLATDDEIKTLTETLFTKEVNSQLKLIRVNAQGKTRSIDNTDEAPQPLLEIDAKAFETPTIAKMRQLFNNYEMDTMINEYVTPNERKEENDFLDAIMATQVMRQAMLFLQKKGLVSPDPKTHRDLIKELWFTQYSRGNGKIGSSGFEHVFANEVKNGTIIGLHNWVYFYDEEKAGRLDYKGYLNQLDLASKGKIMKIRFTHNGLNKPVNTLFIGTSPELELALYTVCFQLKPDRTCPVSLGGKTFGIVTYSWRYRGKNLIGSAYPEI